METERGSGELEKKDAQGCGPRGMAFYAVVLLVLSLALLVFHRIPDDYDRTLCAENWTLNRYITVVLNCDSPEYLRLAREPQDLLQPTSNRQSRPGLVLLAAMLSKITPSSYTLSGWLEKVAGHPLDEFTLELFSSYLPYLLLNFAFLGLSLGLYRRLTGCPKEGQLAVLTVGCLLLFNDVVKAFLFSPNTALLAILAPLYGLWCYQQACQGRLDSGWRLASVALLTGLGVATYTLFAVAVPMIWLGMWRAARHGESPGPARRNLARAIGAALLALVPAAAWVVFVRLETGQFFFSEVEVYSEGIWLWRELAVEPLGAIGKLVANFGGLAAMAAWQAIPAMVVGAAVIAIKRGRPPEVKGWRPTALWVGPALAMIVLCLAFFAVAGIAAERRAYSAVPAVIVLVGTLTGESAAVLSERRHRAITLTAVLVVIAQATILLVKVGPFS